MTEKNLEGWSTFFMFPSVIDLYNRKKSIWIKEGLSESQQLKTAHQINQILTMIQFALKNERHNDLYGVLEKHASRFYTPKEQIRIFSSVEDLLLQGDDSLQKILWSYKRYPEVYEEKFSLNKTGLKFDKIRRIFQERPLPYYSFTPLTKGQNLAFILSKNVWEKAKKAQVFPKPEDTQLYQYWTVKMRSGRKYAYDKMVVRQALSNLLLQAHTYEAMEERSHRTQGR